MAKALYFNAIHEAKEFDVLAKNADGTFNIGIVADKKTGSPEQLVVGSVALAPDAKPKEGHIILVEEPKVEPKKDETKK